MNDKQSANLLNLTHPPKPPRVRCGRESEGVKLIELLFNRTCKNSALDMTDASSLSSGFWNLVSAAAAAMSDVPAMLSGQRTPTAAAPTEQLPPGLIDTALDDQHLVLVFEMLSHRDLLCAAARVSTRWCVPSMLRA